jgi:hypothetical protein
MCKIAPCFALLLFIALASGLTSCATKEQPVAQTPAFGEPVSTIPWNQPQKWEGGGAGFNALRGGESN